MDALEKSWIKDLTEKLARQLIRVQFQSIANVKNANGCPMAQQHAAQTAVNELFNNRSENMAIYLGAREGQKMTALINTLKTLK